MLKTSYNRCIVASSYNRHSCFRKFSDIQHKYANFLSLVKNHGEGTVHLYEAPLDERCMILRFDNTSKRNAISGRMMYELATHIDHLVSSKSYDDKIGLILVGSGKEAFSAGADFSLVKEVVNTPERGKEMSKFMSELLNKIKFHLPFISISLLQGPALGGGAEITTCTDFRLMRNDVFIQFVHAKLGVTPGWGGAARLVDVVGKKNALHILCSSEKLCAEKALRYNYCDGIFDGEGEDEDIKQAVEFLLPYLDMPYPLAIKSMRLSVAAVEGLSRDVANDVATQEFSKRWGGADNKEALQKRMK